MGEMKTERMYVQGGVVIELDLLLKRELLPIASSRQSSAYSIRPRTITQDQKAARQRRQRLANSKDRTLFDGKSKEGGKKRRTGRLAAVGGERPGVGEEGDGETHAKEQGQHDREREEGLFRRRHEGRDGSERVHVGARKRERKPNTRASEQRRVTFLRILCKHLRAHL
jgi:hypothetical protein